FRTISYTAVSDGSGIRITLGAEGQVDRGGAITGAKVTSKPRSEGFAAGVLGSDEATVSTKAPPDGPAKTAAGTEGAQTVGPFEVSGHSYEARSKSEAEDGTPSSTNTATFGGLSIGGGAEAPLGALVEISPTGTSAGANAKGKNVTSASSSTGFIVTLSLSAVALKEAAEQIQEPLCGGLAERNAQLGEVCNAAFSSTEQRVEFLRLEIGEGNVACTWDGKTPDAKGSGATVTPFLLGQALPAISPTSEPVTLGVGTPLETTFGAGSFSKETEDAGSNGTDKVDAIAGGAFARLLGGQVDVRSSTSTCSIAAPMSTDEVLAATGSVVLWYLIGGAALVAASLGLRRFLRPTP
ncbi:MAG TPA: hypothetical protein VM638_00680, partial [Actinomycetota bacterium]|nr:hypothetical protein [Actinomycetota bacterium]